MRPLRLVMTAFGPYAGTEVVDFDALSGLGLFVVAGNNGSGKTTIFDALHYALYGALPGRRANYGRLKSDHADAAAQCSVTLDFAAHGTHWRVERSPKQPRRKRRGTGFTEAPASATLFRVESGSPTAVTNRIDEVGAKCAELVGLSGKQFERVTLLPQGEFSRVLTESGTDRRELLRTLFSSEVFDDATSSLSEQAANATTSERALVERLDYQQASLATELGSLVGQPVASTSMAMHAEIAEFRLDTLSPMAASVAELESHAAQARHAHQAAIDMCERIERRTQLERDLAMHAKAADQYHGDLARVNQARAAVPVASNAQSLAGHKHHLMTAREHINELRKRLGRALATAGLGGPPEAINAEPPNAEPDTAQPDTAAMRSLAVAIDDLARLLTERATASCHLDDLVTAKNRVQTDLRRLGNDIVSLAQRHDLAKTQIRQANDELGRLSETADIEQCEQKLRTAQAQLEQRTELADIEARHQVVVRRATELDGTIETLEQSVQAAHVAHADQVTLHQQADAALAAYESCQRRHDAAVRYQQLAANLLRLRHDLSAARSNAEHLWGAFIAGTAARLADTLIADDPCPVCGSAEHPSPARRQTSGATVTESDVASARDRAEALQSDVRAAEAQIESLRAIDVDIAALSPVELAAEITATKAIALSARSVTDEARRAAAPYNRLSSELASARAERRTVDDKLRTLDQRHGRIHGALGDRANETVSTLRQAVEQAAKARADAEILAERRAELVELITRAEHEFETIGLEQISAESRRATAHDQIERCQRELDTAAGLVADIDEQLAALSPPGTTNTQPLDLRAQACRHAKELAGELITAIALTHEASEHVRRGRSIVNERLAQSPFDSIDAALAAFLEPEIIEQLEAQVAAYAATRDRLHGHLQELSGLPPTAPDGNELRLAAETAGQAYAAQNRALITTANTLDRVEADLTRIEHERHAHQGSDLNTRRLERVAALAKGDNERNISLENWVLAAHLRDIVELANIRLARSTHQRFQLCVLDDGENKRGKWGLDLGVEDTVTGTRRPTAGLSGGELFQASLALALGLADAVMNQTAGVRIDALFIDEGFGALDETSVERAIDLLDELRDRGAMVGVITHVPALLDALPLGIRVIEAAHGQGSTIRQSVSAA